MPSLPARHGSPFFQRHRVQETGLQGSPLLPNLPEPQDQPWIIPKAPNREGSPHHHHNPYALDLETPTKDQVRWVPRKA